MKTIFPPAALELLRMVEQDVAALRSAKQAAFRRRKQDFTSPPDRLEDARQDGLEQGLLIALQTITRRLQLESAVGGSGMSATMIDARLQLQSAEVAYSLADHGACAPISSAAYSTYVQAYKVLEQARAHYARVALNEQRKPDTDGRDALG